MPILMSPVIHLLTSLRLDNHSEWLQTVWVTAGADNLLSPHTPRPLLVGPPPQLPQCWCGTPFPCPPTHLYHTPYPHCSSHTVLDWVIVGRTPWLDTGRATWWYDRGFALPVDRAALNIVRLFLNPWGGITTVPVRDPHDPSSDLP